MEYQGGQNGAGWCVIGIWNRDGEPEPWHLNLVVDEIAEYEQTEELNLDVLLNPELRAANANQFNEMELKRKEDAANK